MAGEHGAPADEGIADGAEQAEAEQHRGEARGQRDEPADGRALDGDGGVGAELLAAEEAGAMGLEDEVVEFGERRALAVADAVFEGLGHVFGLGELGEDAGLEPVHDEVGLRGDAFEGEGAADGLAADEAGVAAQHLGREEEIGVLIHAEGRRFRRAWRRRGGGGPRA